MKKTRQQFPISYMDGFNGKRVRKRTLVWHPNKTKRINPHIIMIGNGNSGNTNMQDGRK